MHRRLAAILAVDIVGYSHLMGADEHKTLSDLNTLNSTIIGPTCAAHGGKIVKSMGDGWLIEFDSAVDAVNCAMNIQGKLATHPVFQLRMGIHAGDVIHQDDDVFGDAVNVAARLETQAIPGGVLISDAAFVSLDGTLTPSFDEGGELTLKNIARPIRVWAWGQQASDTQGTGEADTSNDARRTGMPQLKLIPVACSDERPELQELAESLTGDLDSYLGSLQWIEAGAAGHERDGAAYALRATLRTRGDHLRLEARLNDPGGRQIWSEKFDGELADSFDWQDQTGEAITTQVVGLLLEIETHVLSAITDDQLSAEQAFLLGHMAVTDVSEKRFASGLYYYQKATELSPKYAEAYGELILTGLSASTMGYPNLEPTLKNLPDWVKAAHQIPLRTPLLELALGLAAFYRDRNAQPLRLTVAAALRRAPFNLRLLIFAGWANVWMGEPQSALDYFAKFRRLGRLHPYMAVCEAGSATAHLLMGNDEEAITTSKRGIAISPEYDTFYRVLAAAHALRGEMDQAARAVQQILRLNPHESLQSWKSRSYYGRPPSETRYYRGLELAGLPETADIG